jgi:hypothetical protein
MNELTLEHITPYLPYGLYCINEWDKKSKVVLNFSFENNTDINETRVSFLLKRQYKLILRPLSELNKPICDLEPEVTFNDWLSSEYGIRYNSNKGYFNYGIEKLDIVHLSYEVVLYLLERHFDINNLIGKGLAIDINTVK